MIITLTGIEWGYLLVILLISAALIAFAIYDIKTRRVPNKGLAAFIPLICVSLPMRFFYEHWDSVFIYAVYCLVGAVAGGGILLVAALVTHGGIGGGDIKLSALVGLFYGPYGMLTALLIGTPVSIAYGLIKRWKTKNKELHIAFIPFLAFGALLLTLFKLKGVLFS